MNQNLTTLDDATYLLTGVHDQMLNGLTTIESALTKIDPGITKDPSKGTLSNITENLNDMRDGMRNNSYESTLNLYRDLPISHDDVYDGKIFINQDEPMHICSCPTNTPLAFVAYGNNLFVAVGVGGTIVTSSDGITWTNRTSGVIVNLYSVIYGNNLFVLVGDGGTILTSPDGLTWTKQTSGVDYNFYSITYGNNLYVAVGKDGLIRTSPDSITWTYRRSSITDNFYAITYANNLFVIVGEYEDILTSSDAIDWSLRWWREDEMGNIDRLNSITYGKNLYVAVGNHGAIVTSPDGITWTNRKRLGSHPSSITYADNIFVAVGYEGTIITSIDGLTWAKQTSGIDNWWFSIAHANNLYVVVGGNNVSNAGAIIRFHQPLRASFDSQISVGMNVDNLFTHDLKMIHYDWMQLVVSQYYHSGVYVFILNNNTIKVVVPDINTKTIKSYGIHLMPNEGYITNSFALPVLHSFTRLRFIGSIKGVLYRANDENIWELVSLPSDTGSIVGVVYGNKTYIVAYSYGAILTSTDGTTWTKAMPFEYNTVYTVWFHNGIFFALTVYGIHTSTDGLVWKERITGTHMCIANGNGIYATGRTGGRISISPDGHNWIMVSLDTYPSSIYGIAYGNETFVAVGGCDPDDPNGLNQYTYVWTSNDGRNWVNAGQLSGIACTDLKGIAYGNGIFVAIGWKDGNIYSSYNGINWVIRKSITSRFAGVTLELNSIVWDDRRFIVVGSEGTILCSNDGIIWTEDQIIGYVGALMCATSLHIEAPYGIPGSSSIIDFDIPTSSQPDGFYNIDGRKLTISVSGHPDACTADNPLSLTVIAPSDNIRLPTIRKTPEQFIVTDLLQKIGPTDSFKWFSDILQDSNTDGNYIATLKNYTTNKKYQISVNPLNPDEISMLTMEEKVSELGIEKPVITHLKSITYGNNTYVAVGPKGAIATSPDSITWTNQTREDIVNLNSVTYGNNLFIVVGDSGTILTSPDSITWTKQTSTISTNLISATYGNNLFVAVGNSATILTSPDGITWTKQTSGTSANLTSITYGKNLFVAVGDADSILYSTDAITWRAVMAVTLDAVYSVTYGNNLFVAVGISTNSIIYTSPDGITWTGRASGMTNTLYSITYANNLFVTVGEYGTILTSPDSITWTKRLGGVTNTLRSVTYGNNLFVVVGNSGSILTSPDGITWTMRNSGITSTLNYTEVNAITYGNNLYVAVGLSGTILTSPDGVTWAKWTSGSVDILTSVTYGNNLFVAVEEYGGIILTSPDGITWTRRTPTVTFKLYSVAYGNNRYAAVGGVYIQTSPDGITWTKRVNSGVTNTLRSVTYGNNLFVAVGDGGAIVTSPDSITWTKQTSGLSIKLNSITYGNNLFVAVGDNSTIVTSPDGITWTNQTSGVTNTLNSVTYGNNLFIVVGASGTILTSPDGITWTKLVGTIEYLVCIAYGNKSYITVGPTNIFRIYTANTNDIGDVKFALNSTSTYRELSADENGLWLIPKIGATPTLINKQLKNISALHMLQPLTESWLYRRQYYFDGIDLMKGCYFYCGELNGSLGCNKIKHKNTIITTGLLNKVPYDRIIGVSIYYNEDKLPSEITMRNDFYDDRIGASQIFLRFTNIQPSVKNIHASDICVCKCAHVRPNGGPTNITSADATFLLNTQDRRLTCTFGNFYANGIITSIAGNLSTYVKCIIRV